MSDGSASSSQQPSDAKFAEIVERAQVGEETAVIAFIRYFEGRVYPYIYRLIGNKEETDELYNKFMFKVWKSLPSTNEGLKIPTVAKKWIFKIAYHLTLDHLRTIKHSKEVSLDGMKEDFDRGKITSHVDWYKVVESNAQDVENFICSKEAIITKLDIIAKALKKLSGRYKECFMMRYKQGYSYLKIAQELNIGESTARSYVSQACKILKDEVARLVAQVEGGML